MKTFKKVAEITGYVILLLVICFFTFYTVFNLVAPHRTVSVFGFKVYKVKTDSMEPVIDQGGTVIVTKADSEEVKPGDILAFYRNSSGPKVIITHYVHKIEKDSAFGHVIRTKPNDENVIDYETIYEHNIVGLVKPKNIYSKKSFLGFILNSFVSAAIILAIAIIVITIEAVIVVLEKTSEEEIVLKTLPPKSKSDRSRGSYKGKRSR